MNDFGSNPTAGTAPARGKRQVENFGLITIELPNGMRLDGYILLSEKNAGKLGVTKDKLADLVAKKAQGTQAAKLHISFGDKDTSVAEECNIEFK